ncbi:MAG: tetratricopeptide repeat protein [Bacteroidota bacterium]
MIRAASMGASPMHELDSLQAQLLVVHDEEKAQTLLTLSEAYRNIMFNDCIDYGTKALNLAEELNNNSLKALILKSLGISSYFSGNMDIALTYFKQSLTVYEQIHDKKGQANCLNNIGLIYEKWADFDKATEYLVQSYDMEVELDNKEGMAISLIQIGNISFHRGSFQESIDKYYQALLIFTEIKDTEGIAYSYNSIGIIYGKWNKFDKALEYYQKAKKLYYRTGNKRALSQVLSNMGEVYNFEFKDYKLALNLYNEALQLKNSVEDKVGIALLNNNLGTLYANMEDHSMALKYFDYSLKMYTELGVPTGVVMVKYNLGELYQNSDQINKAIGYFVSSLKMAEENGQVDFIADNYEALIHCYAKQGDYNKFENYYRLLSIGKDSLINKLHELEMIEMEVKYKVEESTRESMQLIKENEEQQVEINKYKLLLTGLGGVVISILFIYILFLRIKRK